MGKLGKGGFEVGFLGGTGRLKSNRVVAGSKQPL